MGGLFLRKSEQGTVDKLTGGYSGRDRGPSPGLLLPPTPEGPQKADKQAGGSHQVGGVDKQKNDRAVAVPPEEIPGGDAVGYAVEGRQCGLGTDEP